MDYPRKHSIASNLALLFLFLTCILYLSFWSSNSLNSNPFSPFRKQVTAIEAPGDELEEVLGKASMKNKTVIISMINRAYADQDVTADTTMLDIFLDSFWVGEDTKPLRNHLLLVAVDQTAYDRCRFLSLNCYKLETDGVDFRGEKLYMSEEFIRMMWTRTWFLLEVLKRGYSFIFTDMDVVWLRNPFEKLSKNETEDLQISTDMFFADPWKEKHQLINTGFYFVRSNNKTIALFDKWYKMKDNSTGQKEQDVLADLIRGGIIGQLGLRVRFLNTVYFSGFCQDSSDFRAVATVHANCCRSINAKVNDLRAVLRDWKRYKKVMSYKRFAKNVNASTFKWTGHWGCWNSWKITDARNPLFGSRKNWKERTN
ncbi:hypothetical protein UlMin_036729 [Ulmus minor]